MPNTLCHIVVQGPMTKAVFPKASLLYISAGCLVPDLPWILFRILRASNLVSLYDAKLYCIVQASFLFCIILSGSIALCTKKSMTVFFILLSNSFVHLVFDAVQVKWGNGVHLLAPFTWDLFSFQWFWPDSPLFYCLSLLGVVYFIYVWKTESVECPFDRKAGAGRWFVAAFLLLLYFTGPLFFMGQVQEADTHYIGTLKDRQNRIGKTIQIDRDYFDKERSVIRLGTGDVFSIEGEKPGRSGTVSMQGYFIRPDTIYCTHFRENGKIRNWASLVGIFLTCLLWLQALLVCRRK